MMVLLMLLITFLVIVLRLSLNNILTSSANCVIPNAVVNQATAFAITDRRHYVSVVTLSAKDNSKLLCHDWWEKRFWSAS